MRPKPGVSSAAIFIGFDKDLPKPVTASDLEVRVNGELCDSAENADLLEPITKIAEPVFMFEIPQGTLHDGRNAVEILPKEKIDGTVVWAEILVLPS